MDEAKILKYKQDREWGHFIRRCEERLGVSLTVGDCKGILRRIKDGRAEKVGDSERNPERTFFRATVKGEKAFVLYSRETESLVTVLPLYWVPDVVKNKEVS